ncbi:MAG: four helix bundle protein [Calditrichaeota bacterium]|nr:four helix bundle protein [Calditrichota bacterium]
MEKGPILLSKAKNPPEDLRTRTKRFALATIRLCESLPKGRTADILARQLIRSACSVGANYRAADCARSKADFVSKLGIVHEECDESVYWFELLVESGILAKDKGEAAIHEATEIVAIIVSSIKTAKDSPTWRG